MSSDKRFLKIDLGTIKTFWWSNQEVEYTDYGHMKAKSLILCSPNSNPSPINILDVDIHKGLVFVEIMVKK